LKKVIVPTLALGLLSLNAFASEEHFQSHEEEQGKQEEKIEKEDFLEISVDYWVAYPSGNLHETGNKIAKKGTLNLEKAKDIGFKAILEGDGSYIPNFIFTYTPIEFEGEGKASNTFKVKDLTVDPGKEFESKEEVINYDLGLLWDIGHLKEKTEDRLDFRAGFSLRYIDYKLEVESEGNTGEIKDTKFIPMLDLEAEVEALPVNQSLTAEIILELQAYIWDGKYSYDFIDAIRLNYKKAFMELGYRVFKSKLEVEGDITKVDAKGGFASLGWMF